MAESGAKFISGIEDHTRAEHLAALRRKKRLHEALPNGYNPNVLFFIRTERGYGATFKQIADKLNKTGYVSPYGKKFYPTTVKRLLDDPIE